MQNKRIGGLMGWFVVSIVLAGVTIGCGVQSASPPTVSVSGGEAVCNLGDVAPGSEHAVVFTIENPRDTIVKIKKIRTDCGCTTLLDQPDRIDARGTAQVKVSFKAPPTEIAYESRTLVQTDYPAGKVIWLVIKTRVVKQSRS